MSKLAWHGLMWPMWVVRGGGSLPLFHSLLVFELCARVLEAETLIGYCILLEKAMNMKIGRVIH